MSSGSQRQFWTGTAPHQDVLDAKLTLLDSAEDITMIAGAMGHDDELMHRLDARDAREGKTFERDEKFEEVDEHMPEVVSEGEDEGAEESEKEELTGSDHGGCCSPPTTFLADDRPPDDDRSKRVRQKVES